jgi:uncharacterized protein
MGALAVRATPQGPGAFGALRALRALLVHPLRLALSALLVLGLAGPRAVQAQDVQPVPALSARVIDLNATLQAPQRQALERKLEALEQGTGAQVVVLIVPTTQPEDIAAYAQRVGEQWKLGRREVGDGILIVVATGDRRMRIEVAKTLEGAVPDLAARQIIDQAMRPAFRAGDYAGGLNRAVDELGARIRGEALPAPARTAQPAERGIQWNDLLIFLFAGVPVIAGVATALLGRKLGSLVTSGATGVLVWAFTASIVLAALAGVLTLVVVGIFGIGSAFMRRSTPRTGRRSDAGWGGFGHGGGFGGGSSGNLGGGFGGFSSGGGGDFGGGGASGDW